jgi:nicotinamide riboside transporter PnuC
VRSRGAAYAPGTTWKIACTADDTAGAIGDARLDANRHKAVEMINRTTLAALAAVTFALLVASAAMGQDFGEGTTALWVLADVVWIGFLLCALALAVMTVAVLVRSRTRSRRSDRAS